MVSFIIYTIFAISFFGNNISGYNLAPDYINWLTEPLVYALFIYSVVTKKENIKLPYLPFIIFFLLAGLFSSIASKNLDIYAFFSFRSVLRFYILFLAIVNLQLKEDQLKNINIFLFWVFIIQIPAATIKLFFYGQGERAIGTYSMSEGALSTIIPMIAISFLTGYYIFYKKNYFLIGLMVGFIYFSIIGGKRAFIFMLPVLMLFIYFMMIIKSKKIRLSISFPGTKAIIIIPILVISVGYFCLKYIPTLNPERKTGGSINLSHALDYAIQSFTGTSSTDYHVTTGRLATTNRIYFTLSKMGFENLFLGIGPGQSMKIRFRDDSYRQKVLSKFRIGYGITPLGHLMIEYGIIGTLAFLIFLGYIFINCLKIFKIVNDPYWAAFAFGTAATTFCMIIWFFSYSTAAFLGDTIPCFFYYCLGVIHYNKNTKRNIFQTV